MGFGCRARCSVTPGKSSRVLDACMPSSPQPASRGTIHIVHIVLLTMHFGDGLLYGAGFCNSALQPSWWRRLQLTHLNSCTGEAAVWQPPCRPAVVLRMARILPGHWLGQPGAGVADIEYQRCCRIVDHLCQWHGVVGWAQEHRDAPCAGHTVHMSAAACVRARSQCSACPWDNNPSMNLTAGPARLEICHKLVTRARAHVQEAAPDAG